jgi:hypothetical protein
MDADAFGQMRVSKALLQDKFDDPELLRTQAHQRQFFD